MELLGSVGIGIVWGWLLILLSRGHGQRPLRTRFLHFALTLLFPIYFIYISNWTLAFTFLISTLIGLFAHGVLLRSLA